METIKISQNSPFAKFLIERAVHKKAIRDYIDGKITMSELINFGVKLKQPVKVG